MWGYSGSAPPPLATSGSPPPPIDWHFVRISVVHLVGCQVPGLGGGVHWRLYLQLSDNPVRSVRVNLKPTGHDLCTGKVEMDEVQYAYSRNYVAGTSQDAPVERRLTPVGFKRMLKHYNLDKYRYVPGTHAVYGCLFWCLTVMKYMVDLGFLLPGATRFFEEEYFPGLHAQNPNMYPPEPVQGEFEYRLPVRHGDTNLFMAY